MEKYVLLIFVVLFISFKVYEIFYYKSKSFLEIKSDLYNYTVDCNKLNQHIETLKKSYENIEKTNYGNADLIDNSVYKFKRLYQVSATNSKYIYDCSATVCKNASNQPFKYLCKYFNIQPNEMVLQKFENTLNDFSAAEEGKILLKNQLESIRNSLKNDVPILIRFFNKNKFMTKVGFQRIDFSTLYFPTYMFRYISPGGNKKTSCEIKFDIKNLNDFILYLSGVIANKKSVAGQRALMTSKLREKIKQRDNYSCKICGNSTYNEANLLLEIDHIIPLSKGGMSNEDNLQTLCWRCNRTKGSKI